MCYIEYGERVNPKAQHRRVQRMMRTLRSLGYQVELPGNALTLVQA